MGMCVISGESRSIPGSSVWIPVAFSEECLEDWGASPGAHGTPPSAGAQTQHWQKGKFYGMTTAERAADLEGTSTPFLENHSSFCSKLLLGKGMRTATFQFSESGGSLNGLNLFTELPFLWKSLPDPSHPESPPPFSLKNPCLH